MDTLVAAHAGGASLALVLGAVNLGRRAKGDRPHRILGRVWLVAMYWTALSSFLIQEIDPGSYSWIHGLSVFTVATLTVGLWAARSGRTRVHRRFMTGSYLGAVGAFVGATAVPQRDLPQLAVHHPGPLAVAALAVGLVAWGVVRLAGIGRTAPTQAPAPVAVPEP